MVKSSGWTAISAPPPNKYYCRSQFVLLALFELLRGIWKHDSTNILYQVGHSVSYFAATHNHRLRDLREQLTNLLGSLLTTTTAASPLTLISEKRACCALDTVLLVVSEFFFASGCDKSSVSRSNPRVEISALALT